jgi:hypothetical protein
MKILVSKTIKAAFQKRFCKTNDLFDYARISTKHPLVVSGERTIHI